MCQGTTRRLCNRLPNCHVRKVASLLAEPLRDELLDRELLANLKEAQVLLEDYRKHYNHSRPHGALDYLTPAEFAAIEELSGQTSGPTEELESLQGLSP